MEPLERLLAVLKKLEEFEEYLSKINLGALDQVITRLRKLRESNEKLYKDYLEELEKLFSTNQETLEKLVDALSEFTEEEKEKLEDFLETRQKDAARLLGYIDVFEESWKHMSAEQRAAFESFIDRLRELRRNLNLDRFKTETAFDVFDKARRDLKVPYEYISRFALDFIRFRQRSEIFFKQIMAFFTYERVARYTAYGMAINLVQEALERYIETTDEVIRVTGIYNRLLRDQALQFYRANIDLRRFGIQLRDTTRFIAEFYTFTRTRDPFALIAQTAAGAGDNINGFMRQMILLNQRLNIDSRMLTRNMLLAATTLEDNIMQHIQLITAFANEANLSATELVSDLVESYSEFVVLLGSGARQITQTQIALARWNMSLRDGMNILKGLYQSQESVIDSLIQIQILSRQPVDFERFFGAMLTGDIEGIVDQLAEMAIQMRGMMDELPIYRMQFERALEGLGLTSEQIATILGKSREQLTGFGAIVEDFRRKLSPEMLIQTFDELLRPNEWEELKNAVDAFFETFMLYGAELIRNMIPVLRILTQGMQLMFKWSQAMTDLIDKVGSLGGLLKDNIIGDFFKSIFAFLGPGAALYTIANIGKLGTALKMLFDLIISIPRRIGGGVVNRIGSFFSRLGDVFKKFFGSREMKQVAEEATSRRGILRRITGGVKDFTKNLFQSFSLGSIVRFTAAVGVLVGGIYLFGKAVKSLQGIDWGETSKGLLAFFGALTTTVGLISLGGLLSLPALLTGLAASIGAIAVVAGGLYLTGEAMGVFASNLQRLASTLETYPNLTSGILRLAGALGALGAVGTIAAPGMLVGAITEAVSAAIKPDVAVKAIIDPDVITAGEKLIANKLDRIIALLTEMQNRTEPRVVTLNKPEKPVEKSIFSTFNF